MADAPPVEQPKTETPAASVLAAEVAPAPAAAPVTEVAKVAAAAKSLLSDGEKPADAAPAAVEFKLKTPEKSQVTAEDVAAIAKLAKDRGLNEEQAQAIVDREAQRLDAHREAMTKQHTEAFNGLYDAWGKQVNDDKDFGGPKLKASVDAARRVIRAHADPEFQKMLETTPFGSHPGLIRMLARIGASMHEDSTHAGSPPAGSAETPAQDVLYPHFAKK